MELPIGPDGVDDEDVSDDRQYTESSEQCSKHCISQNLCCSSSSANSSAFGGGRRLAGRFDVIAVDNLRADVEDGCGEVPPRRRRHERVQIAIVADSVIIG